MGPTADQHCVSYYKQPLQVTYTPPCTSPCPGPRRCSLGGRRWSELGPAGSEPWRRSAPSSLLRDWPRSVWYREGSLGETHTHTHTHISQHMLHTVTSLANDSFIILGQKVDENENDVAAILNICNTVLLLSLNERGFEESVTQSGISPNTRHFFHPLLFVQILN